MKNKNPNLKNMDNYLQFCENLYNLWLQNQDAFQDFARHFQATYLPEPYFPCVDGENELFVLNSNPGHALDGGEQSWNTIRERYRDMTYKQVSAKMAEIYRNMNGRNEITARNRIMSMINFARNVGFDGVMNVETFFLHSNRFDKNLFLKKYGNKEIVKTYTEALKKYLQDKPVLVINAIDTRHSISMDRIRGKEWFKYQADIIGMDLKNAELIPICRKEQRTTSAILKGEGIKFMIFTMGGNNLPRISENIYERLRN